MVGGIGAYLTTERALAVDNILQGKLQIFKLIDLVTYDILFF
jgi:hypothetical protein